MSKITLQFDVGTFNVDFEKLCDPPDYLRIRDVKEWYVDFIADALKDEAHDHEELSSPLLVIASVSKCDFRDKNMSKYSYQVMGSQTNSVKCIFNVNAEWMARCMT